MDKAGGHMLVEGFEMVLGCRVLNAVVSDKIAACLYSASLLLSLDQCSLLQFLENQH